MFNLLLQLAKRVQVGKNVRINLLFSKCSYQSILCSYDMIKSRTFSSGSCGKSCDNHYNQLFERLRTGIEFNPGVQIVVEKPFLTKDGFSVVIETLQCGAEQFCEIATNAGLTVEPKRIDSSIVVLHVNGKIREDEMDDIIRRLKQITDRIGERY